MVHKGLVNVDEVKESVNCVREKQERNLKSRECKVIAWNKDVKA